MTDILDLSGRAALVTGGGQGVGRQIALHLAGAKNSGGVAVNDFRLERAQAVVDEIKKAGGNTTVTSLCKFHGRTVDSATEMSGDFETAFKVTINSTTSGEQDGKPVSVKRTIVQDGKYLGESCGDLKAGEAMGSDGKKIMVQ